MVPIGTCMVVYRAMVCLSAVCTLQSTVWHAGCMRYASLDCMTGSKRRYDVRSPAQTYTIDDRVVDRSIHLKLDKNIFQHRAH